MPKIPINQSTLLGVDPPQFNAHTVRSHAGEGLIKLGEGLTSLGGALHKMRLYEEEKANAAITMDVSNSWTRTESDLLNNPETGFNRLKGKHALEPIDGKSPVDAYTDQYRKSGTEEIDKVKDPDLKNKLQLQFENRLVLFHDKLTEAQNKQADWFALEGSGSKLELAVDSMVNNYSHPTEINRGIAEIEEAVRVQAVLLGEPPEWQQQQTRKAVSKGLSSAISSALLDNNPSMAGNILGAYHNQMEPEHLLKARELIKAHENRSIGVQVGQEAIAAFETRINPNSQTKWFNSLMFAESNHRQFGEDGKPLTSPKGAVGIAQIMPEVGPEAAKLAGLKWDENLFRTSAEYNATIGEALFRDRLQTFQGEPLKAIAAYNAGVGGVNAAIKKAERHNADNPGSEKSWVDFVPDETKGHINKVVAHYRAGAGKPDFPSEESVKAKVWSDPRVAADPERGEIAERTALAIRKSREQAIAQNEQKAYEDAFVFVKTGTPVDQLPVGLQQTIGPEKLGKLRTFEQRENKNNVVTNPKQWLEYTTDGLPALAAMSDAEFESTVKKYLSNEDFRNLTMIRAEYQGKIPGKGLDVPAMQELNRILGVEFAALGLGKDKESNKVKGSFSAAVTNAVVQQQKVLERRLIGKELTEFVHGLFVKDAQFKKTFMTFEYGKKESKRLINVTYNDLEDVGGLVSSLKASLRNQGVSEPTEDQVLIEYWNQRLQR